MIESGVTPHIPVWDKSTREDGTFSRADFTFDKERNVYVCPAGKLLTTTGSVGADHVLRYLALKRDCEPCPLKPRCCPKTPSRKVTRDVNEDARDHARALMGTPEFAKSRDERKKVEMRFAHLKTHHRFERMRLRGLSGARDEFHLAAIVQNLKTLANHIWRPPPNVQAAMRRVSVSGAKRRSCERRCRSPTEARANDRQKRNKSPPALVADFINTIEQTKIDFGLRQFVPANDPKRTLAAPQHHR